MQSSRMTNDGMAKNILGCGVSGKFRVRQFDL